MSGSGQEDFFKNLFQPPPPAGAEAAPLDAVPVEEVPEVPPPPNPFEESVLEELEKIRNPKGNWTQAVMVLVVSLLLFLALGMGSHPIAFTATLVGILFFHELGHYVGMRIFGYRNVRMFFIPLFGAAVSGQKTNAKSYQEAIVSLLGPVPGLCLAAVLLVAALVPVFSRDCRNGLLWVAILLGLINGFNLLPIYPLDGGRLLNQILFSRNRYLESAFQFLAAIALVAYGATHGKIFLCVFGVLILPAVTATFKTNMIARNVGRQFPGELPPINGPIPPAIFRAVVQGVKAKSPALKTAKGMAGVVFRVWEKMHARPPGAVATAALLAVYLLAWLLTLPWIALFMLGKR
ncbi:MAG: site-2 protease family protein [Thermoguttaceae bacterium]